MFKRVSIIVLAILLFLVASVSFAQTKNEAAQVSYEGHDRIVPLDVRSDFVPGKPYKSVFLRNGAPAEYMIEGFTLQYMQMLGEIGTVSTDGFEANGQHANVDVLWVGHMTHTYPLFVPTNGTVQVEMWCTGVEVEYLGSGWLSVSFFDLAPGQMRNPGACGYATSGLNAN